MTTQSFSTVTKLTAAVLASTFALTGCDSLSPKDESAAKAGSAAERRGDYADEKLVAASPAAMEMKREEAGRPAGADDYKRIVENNFLSVADQPLSTFAVDVDTASYSNVRRFLEDGSMPPADAVRIEEMVNYFNYDYEAPTGDEPFSVNTEVGDCPWAEGHKLVHVGLKGEMVAADDTPARNLVFLIDVSGSMSSPDKLPLLKKAFKLMIGQLDEDDSVSIVVYAGASGVVLEPTPGSDRVRIMEAFDRLSAGGGTNGAAGIQAAYGLARKAFVQNGINRVILATDGDFNVGTTSQGALERLIEEERESGVYLSVFGFGTGNLKDSTMEMLADKGNGNYGYIDTLAEARKLLVEQAGATLMTIAKDVKIQVEFNPVEVASYRLIGYENRLMAAEDFNDDTKDAGEIGAGHTVTALYEVVPVGAEVVDAKVDPKRYTKGNGGVGKKGNGGELLDAAKDGELAFVKLRHKEPEGDGKSILSTTAIKDADTKLEDTSDNFRFSAAVASFGMLLRNSEHKGTSTWDSAKSLARGALGQDPHGYRGEMLELIDLAAKHGDAGPKAG